jgi:conjugal transfer pilus assembly protein TraF
MLIVKCFLLLAFLGSRAAFASWYDQKLEGWYYFEEQSSSQENPPITPEEADELIALESRKLKQLLSLALVLPSPENVEQYIRAQRRWIQQSNMFAQTWGKTLLEHPNLGDYLTTPTSSYGILAKRAYEVNRRKELIQNLSKDYFLLLFFKGKDPFSEKMAEVVLLFSSTNGWKYKAVSLDGIGVSQLEEFEIDKGISQNFGIGGTPCFYIVNPIENQIYPVGAGLISVSEIEENIEIHLGEQNE